MSTGRFDHIVSVADVHGDDEAALRSLWIARNYIAASSSGDWMAYDALVQLVESEMEHGHEEHDVFEGCARVLLVQVRHIITHHHAPHCTPPSLTSPHLQLGDIVDRGPNVIGSMRRLHAASRALRWNFIRLLGNHEILSIIGDDSYAHVRDDAFVRFGEGRAAAFAPGGDLFKSFER